MSLLNVVSVVAAFVGGAAFCFALIHWRTLKGLADQRITWINH